MINNNFHLNRLWCLVLFFPMIIITSSLFCSPIRHALYPPPSLNAVQFMRSLLQESRTFVIHIGYSIFLHSDDAAPICYKHTTKRCLHIERAYILIAAMSSNALLLAIWIVKINSILWRIPNDWTHAERALNRNLYLNVLRWCTHAVWGEW